MVRKRELTYMERKFNRLGRHGLINYFKTKYDPSKVQQVFWSKHDIHLKSYEAKALIAKLEEKTWEEQKGFILSMVDAIIHFTEMFDLSNLEAFAMWVHVMRDYAQEGKRLGRALAEEEVDKVIESSMRTAYELYEDNPNRFLDILKIFR